MAIVIHGMQFPHSCFDSSLQVGICKLELRGMLQAVPRVCEHLHFHLHGHSGQR